MGPVLVGVVDVVDHDPLELLAIPDEGAVEELAAQGAYPSFGERIRDGRPDGSLQDLDAFGAEDLVACSRELAGAVAHQGLAAGECRVVADEQVACCLSGPVSGGVSGDPGVEHAAGVDVDEEQQVVAAETTNGVDTREVTRAGLGRTCSAAPSSAGLLRPAGHFERFEAQDYLTALLLVALLRWELKQASRRDKG